MAFWSRVLAGSQRGTWTPSEKEAYAIVMALRKWTWYIALHLVTFCTDHQSLQSWHKEHPDLMTSLRKGKIARDFGQVQPHGDLRSLKGQHPAGLSQRVALSCQQGHDRRLCPWR